MVAKQKNVLTEIGYARVEKVFTPSELAAIDVASLRLIQKWQAGFRHPDFWSWPCTKGNHVLTRIHNFERKTTTARALLESTPFCNLLARVFPEGAHATACALVIKMPGQGLPVPLHRDPISAPLCKVYNFGIYLDSSTERNGCLYAVPRSHIDRGINATGNDRPLEAMPIHASPGDVIIHEVSVLHGSGPNPTATIRRAMVVEFQAFSVSVNA